MTDEAKIPADVILLLRIPSWPPWMAEGPRVTSANFDPKPEETGISVSLWPPTSPAQLLALSPDPDHFRVAALSVGGLHQLGLDVEVDPTADDLGHAEIRPAERLRRSRSLRKQLARKCKLLPEDAGQEGRAPS